MKLAIDHIYIYFILVLYSSANHISLCNIFFLNYSLGSKFKIFELRTKITVVVPNNTEKGRDRGREDLAVYILPSPFSFHL